MVVSMTLDSSLLNKIIGKLNEYDIGYNPLRSILISPLFAHKSTLQMIRKLKDEMESIIYFDSGGYYVQQGKIEFKELCSRLLKIYSENPWADYFVLPDNPPTSSDSDYEVEMKVRETITATRTFYEKLPRIRENCIPVVHGHTLSQVSSCVRAYEEFEYIGFGSFATSGENNSINSVSYTSLEIVKFVVQNTTKLHVFGVSTPPAIYLFYMLGVHSFDSIGWLRSAGFGKVFLPFVRAHNITHRSMRYSSLSREDFEHLKTLTGHECPFCEDFRKLQNDRIYRALHNLIVMYETVEFAKRKNPKEILGIMSKTSDKYYKMIRGIIDHGNTTSLHTSK